MRSPLAPCDTVLPVASVAEAWNASANPLVLADLAATLAVAPAALLLITDMPLVTSMEVSMKAPIMAAPFRIWAGRRVPLLSWSG